ncbi:hypothetical protein [Candidatus Odyssella acanthamoebae]|uniref:BioF2-like acetyltransferase domain-containing protein n=1 Tax=Candidatus Odyssella acanthamoebae TaxID=91604 RepID=A0A077AY80_9PROT|nr:hypothetical protein [Candidatus Paracaedibacter acanthamoebae]AIK96944.1 hypothetical protein ID47_09720 [Candidatus Paracaedibacter acanthamoebae]
MSIELTPIIYSPFNSKVELLQQYYQAYYGTDFSDQSMAIVCDGKAIGYVCASSLEQVLSQPGSGLEIMFSDLVHSLSMSHFKDLVKLIINHAIKNDCSLIKIKDNLSLGKLSPLGEVLFNEKFQSKLTFEMVTNYEEFAETTYYTCIRKSYKSLINWGRKNLKIDYINKDNADRNSFKTFQEFHKKISGRVTRSDISWNKQFEMIENGIGELIMAYLNDEVVGGSLFIDQLDYSAYFTGVYERDLFQYGLSHYLLYLGIVRSFERRQTKFFSLGHFDTDIQDPKWYNIQFFKKGFASDLIPTVIWTKEIK